MSSHSRCDVGLGVVGLLDLDELAVAAQEELGFPERDGAGDEVALEALACGRDGRTTATSSVLPSKTSLASSSGVPRFHSLTIRG